MSDIGMPLFYIACGTVLLAAFSLMMFRMSLNSQLNAKLAEIRAAGYPATLAELDDYYPAVPDNENAALLYEKLRADARIKGVVIGLAIEYLFCKLYSQKSNYERYDSADANFTISYSGISYRG
ncbi:MAG: hypothetical protein L3J71_02860 [Victivallaceae bacterium]|nr:hypothetical protein [Victivallaceae bacterium]